MRDVIADAAARTDIGSVTFDIDSFDPQSFSACRNPVASRSHRRWPSSKSSGELSANDTADPMEVAPPYDAARSAAYLLTTLLEQQFTAYGQSLSQCYEG
ncbi:hypothetical protein [Natrinema amylolyticum]|uniref:hypothetical protein n=1 Tax=Natrinema amylolyticum TaxID=2878679 RepID=UPI001CFA249F|nr:hypothetical protein [Natrinema amylolyticum]